MFWGKQVRSHVSVSVLGVRPEIPNGPCALRHQQIKNTAVYIHTNTHPRHLQQTQAGIPLSFNFQFLISKTEKVTLTLDLEEFDEKNYVRISM